jgi:uncharacterized protein
MHSSNPDPALLERTWRLSNLRLPVDHPEAALPQEATQWLGVKLQDIEELILRRRSLDARKRNQILYVYSVDVVVSEKVAINPNEKNAKNIRPAPDLRYQFDAPPPQPENPRPVVIGAGPCGLFAGLLLAESGLRPILLERGKPAKERSRDVQQFWRTGVLDPDSNALFGEGGAGAFSDGKLTTQIKDRQNRCRKVLEELVRAGAPEEILFAHKPHVGTDKLMGVITRLRQRIEALGGEVRFNCRADAFEAESGQVRSVRLDNGESLRTDHVILAVGHSARDTFERLASQKVQIQPKPFSIGLRIEHLQEDVNRAQWGAMANSACLGAAEYKLVHHGKHDRSVYTFCMCPGGQVIAAASEPGHLVTNGMSLHARNRANANSALLVGIRPEDFASEADPLAGVAFQRRWEKAAFLTAGENYHAPVQLVGDFLAGKASTSLGKVEPSYRPGVQPTDLAGCLPDYAVTALREAIPALERKLKGFAQPEAVLTGVETRSSSPIRIVRDEYCESVTLPGLYPAGEGAGYAGGIISAAVDGLRVAESVAQRHGQVSAK